MLWKQRHVFNQLRFVGKSTQYLAVLLLALFLITYIIQHHFYSISRYPALHPILNYIVVASLSIIVISQLCRLIVYINKYIKLDTMWVVVLAGLIFANVSYEFIQLFLSVN